jgi:hypothetical protein
MKMTRENKNPSHLASAGNQSDRWKRAREKTKKRRYKKRKIESQKLGLTKSTMLGRDTRPDQGT